MQLKEIIDFINIQKSANDFVSFPDHIFGAIDQSIAIELASIFGGNTLFMLPSKEITFFEWLKSIDNDIWYDLWGVDELGNEPYIVGFKFLPEVIKKTRGYPICDLINNDNYFFTPAHIVDEESKILVETAKTLFMDNKKLAIHQLLILEISLDYIDVWRFAFNHKIDLASAKEAVEILKKDGALVHLTSSEHLSNFIEF